METIKQVIYRTYKVEHIRNVTDIRHNIPTWFYPEQFAGPVKTPCPICHKEMRLNIAHGQYVEHCSVIQLDGHDAIPIHTNCFFGSDNYFEQEFPLKGKE